MGDDSQLPAYPYHEVIVELLRRERWRAIHEVNAVFLDRYVLSDRIVINFSLVIPREHIEINLVS